MSNPLVTLLGDKVHNKEKEEIDVSTLSKEGGVLGLYFTAHWCGPCRSFTPALAKFYDNFKKTEKGDGFKIVFVSSDRDEAAFDNYFKEMPWLALSFTKRDVKEKLAKKFKVRGIPTLVFLESHTAKVITVDGRNSVMEDPEGQRFPWTPKPFQDIFSGKVLLKDDSEVTTDSLQGRILGLYFSAHWIIAWSDLLLLLEGEEVHLPAPKTHFARDIVFDKDSPVFCTSSHQLIFIKGGQIDERETEMMSVRWKTFHLNSQIPQEEQRNIPPCGRCFASLVLSSRK